MQQGLSPEELQALLVQRKEATGAGQRQRRLRKDTTVRPFSLVSSLTLTPRQRAMLHQWAEQMAHALRYTLISMLRIAVEVRLQSDALVPLTALVKEWQKGAYIATFSPLGVLGNDHCVALSTPLAMVALDRLLGGPGLPSSVQRALGRLEVSLLLRFMEQLGRVLVGVIGGEASENQTVRASVLLSTPEQLTLFTDQQMVYTFCYEIRLGAESGQAWLCLHADALKGLERSGGPKISSPPDRARQHPVAALPLTLRVVLGKGRVSFRELQRLRVGDVLLLDAFKGTPVPLCWGERTLCLVRPGVRGGQFAVQVVEEQSVAQRGDLS
ncbi:hypothetical protein HRbin17_01524 [bacterium HR17]|uniref:Flagellar motor switch protein FliM n=1 Tax=Candidatus Fervidibacter japonicus TaxID=2035412 RepID=A0A2H5XCU6_9BACT|nr:hypothetical protein HRbin17_01524 [bacterium HR17]